MSTAIVKVLVGAIILSVFLVVGLAARGGSEAERDTPDTIASETPEYAGDFTPAYLELHETGELARRAAQLWSVMESCVLCPRECGVNRLAGERGYCQAPGSHLVIASVQPHPGEERPLVGRGGSGTIFFSHCNLRCVFCQNYQISILGRGRRVTIDDLAEEMLKLQNLGCHNINVVTPTHYTPHIVAALDVAAGRGLRLPVVWNTSGWERVEVLEQLDGIVDIYLPDIKYADAEEAGLYSRASGYPEQTRKAVLEMHRQVGVAHPNEEGIINRGLMIRHLVMPDSASGSKKIVKWIHENLPEDTYVNIMAQYSPRHEAFQFPRIARRITDDEYRDVVSYAQELGLSNLDSRTARWLR